MGIPSYFVHIVKNYPNIIKEFKNTEIIVHNLYLDSNSIIYDAIRDIKYSSNDKDFEKKITSWVCDRIVHYIDVLKPRQKVLIAFDGVAPVAKLEQQRNRRYKTWYVNDNLNKDEEEKKEIWDTTAVTPGSSFMNRLGKDIAKFFENKYKTLDIVVSDSQESGEGEHKIFEYIRNNKKYHYDLNTIIYGLDADLIMLTMIHLKISINLYLFRETPQFISSINSNLVPDQHYVLDIYELDQRLNEQMYGNNEKSCTIDYIFLCFLLGNDFMPHFPALNIRTHGIQILLDVYKKIFTKEQTLINKNKICWANVRKLIEELAKTEEEFCITEMKQKDKMEYNIKNRRNREYSKEDMIMAKPIFDRTKEKYINIGDNGWQQRYYKELFDIDITDERRQQICVNYLEGLEWNLKYYTTDCPDWGWCYKYKYPPLLQDLQKYVPHFDTIFVPNKPKESVDPLVQLAYVLPRNSLYLLPPALYKELITTKPEWYKLDYEILWAYCRYLWEGHVVLPHIDLPTLKNIVKNY